MLVSSVSVIAGAGATVTAGPFSTKLAVESLPAVPVSRSRSGGELSGTTWTVAVEVAESRSPSLTTTVMIRLAGFGGFWVLS